MKEISGGEGMGLLEDARDVALNDVILSCSDAADQYETASSIVEDEYLRGLFHGFAEVRKKFASRLEEEMRNLEKLPIEPDTEKEALESLWMRIKTTIKKDQEAVLLREGVKLENNIVACCRNALKQEIPEQLSRILEELEREADSGCKRMEKELDLRQAG